MSNEQLSTRVAILATNHLTMMEKLNEFQQENKEQHKELKEMIEKALESKANKSTVDGIVKFLWILGTTIGTGLIGFLGLQLSKLIKL